MRTSVARGLLGGLGTLLYIGSLAPVALSFNIAQRPPALQCNSSEVTESAAREWLERSRQSLQKGQLELAARSLSRTLQLAGQLPNTQAKADIIRAIAVRETQTAVPQGLAGLVDRALATAQPNLPLSLLPAARQVAQSLPPSYSAVKTEALTDIATYYAKLNQPQQAAPLLSQALQASNSLQGEEFKAKALTAIAGGYQAIANSERAIALLDRALPLARAAQVPNALRRAWMLEPIAITYAKAGAFDKGLQVAQMIPDSMLSYRDGAIAAIAQQYALVGQFDRALEVVETIEMASVKATALAQLARISERAGQSQQAQTLFERALTVTPDVPLPAILEYAEAGQLDAALAAADKIAEARTRARTLLDLAARSETPEQQTAILKRAVAAARQIAGDYERSDLIKQAVEKLLATEQYTVALQIVRSLDGEDFSSASDKLDLLSQIAEQAIAAGEFALALQGIDAMAQGWVEQRNRLLQAVAIGYAEAGQYDKAMPLVPPIDNSGSAAYRVRTLTAIAQQAAAAGESDRADALIDQALQVTDTLETPSQKTDALTALAIAFAKMGRGDQAEQLQAQALQLAQSAGEPSHRGYLLRQMVQQYIEAGSTRQAIATARGMEGEEEQSRLLSEVVTDLLESERVDTALPVIAALPKPEDKTRFLLEVADRYIARGEIDRATAILPRAFEVAQTIEGPESRTIQVREDLVVDDTSDRGSMFEAIALKYAEVGQYNRAVEVARMLQNPDNRDSLLQRLGCSGYGM